MKKYRVYFAILTLILASFACQTVMGGGSDSTQLESVPPTDTNSGDDSQPSEESSTDGFELPFGGDSDFPMTSDASNVVSFEGTVNYQTKLSIEDVMAFYRDVYGKEGFTERENNTVVSDGVFSMAFDGDSSGKAILIQGVDLGDGNINVTVTLQDF